MKAIHDAGYHTILPHQLYNYLAAMITTLKTIILPLMILEGEQFSIGAMEWKNIILKAYSL
jgi:hypothetical protein